MKLTKTKKTTIFIVVALIILYLLTGCATTQYTKPEPTLKYRERSKLIYHHGWTALPEMRKEHIIHIKRDIIVHIVKDDNPLLKRHNANGLAIRSKFWEILKDEPYHIWVKGKEIRRQIVPKLYTLGHEFQRILKYEKPDLIAGPYLDE